MRAIAMFLFLAIAVPCHAEDPLETLNTIEDTLNTMERALKMRAGHAGSAGSAASATAGEMSERLPLDDRLYFVSDEAVGADNWVAVTPCTEEFAASQGSGDARSCVAQPDGTVAMGPYFWKSRPAAAEDLQVGATVVVRDQSGDGGWVLATITDISQIESGFVATSAPFRAPLAGLRVVE